jgi:NOL1/NOP2/fmu family ribosome biogenesis protein
MNFLKILNKREKAEIEKKLKEQFGIEEVPGIIVRRGEERLFLFSGDMSEKDIKKLEAIVPIERVGFYFAKIMGNDIRLSIEGSQILSAQINKNIFELDEKQAEEWMKGHELPIKTGKHGFLIMKHGEDFLGTGKASEEKIGNFIPKNRRLKERQGGNNFKQN